MYILLFLFHYCVLLYDFHIKWINRSGRIPSRNFVGRSPCHLKCGSDRIGSGSVALDQAILIHVHLWGGAYSRNPTWSHSKPTTNTKRHEHITKPLNARVLLTPSWWDAKFCKYHLLRSLSKVAISFLTFGNDFWRVISKIVKSCLLECL